MIHKILKSQRNSIFVILVLTALCYSTLYKNEFVSFDDGFLIRWHFLVAPEKVPFESYFQYNFRNPHFKPLVYLSWHAEHKIFGDNPVPFHLNNLLLHLINAVLVFLLGLKLFEKLNVRDERIRLFAFLMALLFAIHPMRVESVAWATERKDVLYSFFFLLAWLSYLKHLENRKTIFLVLSIAGYMLSLLSKSMGITLIAVLAMSNLLYHKKLVLKSLLTILPFAIVFVFSLYMYGLFDNFKEHAAGITNTTILDNVAPESNERFSEQKDLFDNYPVFVQRIIFISFRLVLWIAHILVPLVLSVMYPREQFLEFFGKAILLFPFIMAALLYLVWRWRNKNLLYLFGILFFIITISPAIAINEKGSGVFLPDRYTYLPSLGIYLALIGILMNTKIKPKVVTGLVVVYLAFLGFRSFSQVKVWENSENLWNNTVKYFPNFARGLNSRGYYYMTRGEREKALRDFTKAIKNDPGFIGPYNNRCNLLFAMGKYEEALGDIDILLRAQPNKVKYITTKAGILSKLNRTDEAIEFSKKAIELDSESLESHKNLSIIYLKSRRFTESVQHWEKVVQLEPENPLNYADMGYALLMVARNQDALNAFDKAIQLKPDLATAWYNRSFTYNRLGNKEKAMEDALQAKKLGANVTEAYLNRLR